MALTSRQLPTLRCVFGVPFSACFFENSQKDVPPDGEKARKRVKRTDFSFRGIATSLGTIFDFYSHLQLAISAILLVFALNHSVKANTDPPVNDNLPIVMEEILPEADKMAFATAFEQAAREHRTDNMNALIDWENILKAITSGLDNPAQNRAREGFKTGFISSQLKGAKQSLAGQLVEVIQQGGSFKFLRLSEVNSEPVALFRVKLPKQGGANYHWYFLKRSDDGLVRAHDVYIFLTAERITESVRRVWLPLSEDVNKTIFEKWTKPVDPVIVAVQTLEKMHKLIADGRYDKVLEMYRNLPEKVQKEKVLLLVRLRAAMNISEEEYSAAIEAYREQFPGDAALDFLLIDGYSLKKEFQKALECITRTNDKLGGDAWLISLSSIVLSDLQQFDEAKTQADKAIEMEPDLEDLYWNAIAVSIRAKNNDDTARLLTMVEQNLGRKIGDLTESSYYADFVKSPQYTKWLESRK